MQIQTIWGLAAHHYAMRPQMQIFLYSRSPRWDAL